MVWLVNHLDIPLSVLWLGVLVVGIKIYIWRLDADVNLFRWFQGCLLLKFMYFLSFQPYLSSVFYPQIYKGDPRAPMIPGVIVSHGAPIGVIWDFADHTSGNKCKQTASTIFVRRFTHVYLHAETAVHMHLTNHCYFHHRKKPEYPELDPHAGIKMAQVLGRIQDLRSISLILPHLHTIFFSSF